MLTDKQISKFQEIYKNHFGQEIGRDEALEKGIKLVQLVKIICRPNSLNMGEENNEINSKAL